MILPNHSSRTLGIVTNISIPRALPGSLSGLIFPAGSLWMGVQESADERAGGFRPDDCGSGSSKPRPLEKAAKATAIKKRPGIAGALRNIVPQRPLASHRDGRRVNRAHAADFADFEAHEAPHRDVFSELGDRLVDHFADGHGLILDVVLFVQAILLVELFHLAGHDFLDDLLGFPGGLGLFFVNVALAV